ncbi:hypothetical protein [Leclercia sp. 29361]|jgi:hypothetical protein|nr:hypothetical protein [Leclercia sp. 29361]
MQKAGIMADGANLLKLCKSGGGQKAKSPLRSGLNRGLPENQNW